MQGHRATGIAIDGEVIRARLVVGCAGAIMTPHLLMHSGIGAPQQLEAFGE